MTPDPSRTTSALDDAMKLFNAGKFADVISLVSGTSDPALLLLAARSYTETGQYDTAGYLLCDLIQGMPASSYLHSYLADVMEKTGDEHAVSEYATALILDPENRPALRSYARLLLARSDLRGAIPSLRSLVRFGSDPADIRLLMKTLTEVGEPGEAAALHVQNFGEDEFSPEYVEALLAAKEYQKAMSVALRGWNTVREVVYLRLDLEALAALDPEAAESAYRSALDSFEEEQLEDDDVAQIRFSFVLLEKLLGHYDAARYELGILVKNRSDPVYRLLEAELAARTSHADEANAIYRQLIAEQCGKDSEVADPAMQELVINRFKVFLDAVRSKEEVAGIISVLLSSYPTAVCLTQIGAAYEDARACTQARDWYYRAYRADYIHGGISYAGFLKRLGEDRECETVIRYILTNVTRAADVELVAGEVLNGKEAMYRIPKVMEQVLTRLTSVLEKLSSNGREMLAVGLLYAAGDALERQDYEECKWHCLLGLDVMPCYPAVIKVEDFMQLLSQAKGRALAERPVLLEKNSWLVDAADVSEPEPAANLLDLDEREQQVVAFLREHREATEMDLRSVLGTRRVTGIVNGILAKASEKGVKILEKRGVGDRGEIYGYTGE
ncbi:hypothetical protein [Methanorbis rubei]|uniref:Tetratricopeptide repeat protein n=1 Tax=Methanorbis rubei TaxID=3028300 RepID=A0AAE4MHA4_9EURY|nr:hypothetical protein [Methanocorpusculaceae archaeon Cs1]